MFLLRSVQKELYSVTAGRRIASADGNRVGSGHGRGSRLQKRIEAQTVQQIVDRILGLGEGTRAAIMAPIARARRGELKLEIERLRREGFVRARIDGEVQASHIVVNGTINGPVHATETLELQPNSRVKGDVHYKSIEIHQGAVVEGGVVVGRHEVGHDRQDQAGGEDDEPGD